MFFMSLQWLYNSTSHTITSKLDGKCVDGSYLGTSDGTNVQVRGTHSITKPSRIVLYIHSNGIVVEQTIRRLHRSLSVLAKYSVYK